MSLAGCLIAEQDDGWQVWIGEKHLLFDGGADFDDVARSVSQSATEQGLLPVRCVVAPASKSCFFANLILDADMDAKDRVALSYLLEDRLPVDAESLVVDYGKVAAHESGDRTVPAIALPWKRWFDLIDALEKVDCLVVSVVPQAVLITRGFADSKAFVGQAELVLVSTESCDVVLVDHSGVTRWKHLPLETEALQRHSRLNRAEASRFLVTPNGWESANECIPFDVEPVAESSESYLIESTNAVFAGKWGRWTELRRDALAPKDPLRPIAKQLRVVALAAALCLCAIVASTWIRNHKIESKIRELNQKQRQSFQDAFPGTRVPVMLMRHVRREHTKVVGSRGGASEIEIPTSATDVLRSILSALPSNVRFRLVDLNIEGGECDLTVRVRDSSDIGIIANALEAAGFSVDPPATQRMEPSNEEKIPTYESSINAVWSKPSEADAGGET